MSTYITKQDQVNEDIKQIGIFLWVVTAIYVFQILFLDPFLIIDALLVALMAYYAYSKVSIKAVYFGIGYYLLDTAFFLTVLDFSPHVLIIRCLILYWMINTAYKSYSLHSDSTELVLDN